MVNSRTEVTRAQNVDNPHILKSQTIFIFKELYVNFNGGSENFKFNFIIKYHEKYFLMFYS